MKKLPGELLIYQCDEVDGQRIYAVAHTANEIPEEYDGEMVGVYYLNQTLKFGVKRELK